MPDEIEVDESFRRGLAKILESASVFLPDAYYGGHFNYGAILWDSAQMIDDLHGRLRVFEGAVPLERKDQSALLVRKGNEMVASQQYEKAVECYSNAIEIHPSAWSYYYRSVALYNLNQFDRSEEDCMLALLFDRKVADFHYALGRSLLILGKLERAVESFKDAVKLDGSRPDYAEQLNQAAVSFLQQHGISANSVKFAQMSAQHGGIVENAMNLIGQIHDAPVNNEVHRADSGRSDGTRMIDGLVGVDEDPQDQEIMPDEIEVDESFRRGLAKILESASVFLPDAYYGGHFNYGAILWDSAQMIDDLHGRLRVFEGAVPLERKDQSALLVRKGNEMVASQQYEKAVECYSNAIEIHPSAWSYYYRSVALYNLNQFDRSEEDCMLALLFDRKVADFHYALGRSLLILGKLERAVESFKDAVKLDGSRTDYAEQLNQAAICLLQQHGISADSVKFAQMSAQHGGIVENAMNLIGQIHDAPVNNEVHRADSGRSDDTRTPNNRGDSNLF